MFLDSAILKRLSLHISSKPVLGDLLAVLPVRNKLRKNKEACIVCYPCIVRSRRQKGTIKSPDGRPSQA